MQRHTQHQLARKSQLNATGTRAASDEPPLATPALLMMAVTVVVPPLTTVFAVPAVAAVPPATTVVAIVLATTALDPCSVSIMLVDGAKRRELHSRLLPEVDPDFPRAMNCDNETVIGVPVLAQFVLYVLYEDSMSLPSVWVKQMAKLVMEPPVLVHTQLLNSVVLDSRSQPLMALADWRQARAVAG